MKSLSASVSAILNLPFVGNVLRWVARRYKEGSVVTIPFGPIAGIKWKRSHQHVSGYWSGLYELEIQEALSRQLKPGMVFYDVGANAGFFAILAAKLVGAKGRVVAFEPLIENVRSIETQIELNGFRHCTVIPAAVSNISGEFHFERARNLSMGRLSPDSASINGVEVKTMSLDDAVAELPFPDFIKVDVEGAEVQVLEGSRNLLTGKPQPGWLIELHGYEKSRSVWRSLTDHGYRITDLSGIVLSNDGNPPHHIFATPK